MPSELDRRLDAAMARLTAGPTTPLPTTLPEFFRTFCVRYADREALVAGEERIGFGALDKLSDRLARALVGGWGVKKGDRVAIAMHNVPAWIACYMAVAKAGGLATLLNIRWDAAELAQALDLTEPVLAIADAQCAGRIAAAREVRTVTLAIERAIDQAVAPLFALGEAGILPEVADADDATILFTSGATGLPRGAVSTHRAVTAAALNFMTHSLANRAALAAAVAVPPGPPVVLGAAPLFHVTGAISVMLNSFALGRRIVLMRRWDAGEALRLIAAERVTYFVGVPTMSLELMQHPDLGRHDLGSLAEIVAGGAARPVAHVPRLAAAFPAGHPAMGYGLTETNATGCTNIRANYLAKPASTGRPQRPFVDIAILSEDGARLPPGARGEIAIRSTGNARGYWRDEEATAALFAADSFLRTGDIGYLDADGYLFIVDRAKDIIIRGGENIGCQEIEAVLYAHPAVAEACVFGLADERLGETPGAIVALRPGAAVELSALADFVAARLARFKRPTRIWLSDTPLPKLGTGKIDKPRLRAAYGGS